MKQLFITLAIGLLGGLIGASLLSSANLGAAQNLTTVGNPWSFTNLTSPGGGGGVTMASSTLTRFKVAQDGTQVTGINTGFCNIYAYATTIAASSTGAVDCQTGTASLSPLQGVAVNDVCFVGQATTTPNTVNGLVFQGSASTTNGYISMRVINNTGGTFTWTAAASTSIPYVCLDL